MGIQMSTLIGWSVIVSIGAYIYWTNQSKQPIHSATKSKKKLEHTPPSRKEPKEKAKRQRTEAFANENKAAQTKPKAAETYSAPSRSPDYSSDDVDNKEFARRLASVKQGTSLSASKKDEKRQKSVKQSRAQAIDKPAANGNKKASAPSSTAGADADDDESPVASPEVVAADAGDVTDMLEPKSAGPAVLRLTDTEKTKKQEKKAKVPEKVETKKQRQNRQKAEAAKAAREEAEKDRQVALENQRRLARISEGRAAKDGSAFMAAQAVQSVWKDDGANTKLSSSNANGATADEPLNTFSDKPAVPVKPAKAAPPVKAANPTHAKSETWISSLPSEEEQLELIRGQDDSWSTVTTKKAKTKKRQSVSSQEELEATDAQVAKAPTPVVSQPAAAAASKPAVNGNGSAKPVRQGIQQQSSFAALSVPDDEEEIEKEWDV
ncbi:hypothetical protein QBC39DRAFT_5582 [Podospora conica]|nr:hypothetical protein QBC39DRAFT_5582 [Schizothecium conicum]